MTGLHLAHYRIDAELGRGGMGIVYRAFDTKLDRTVALKVLPASALSSADDRARFFREAKAAAQLSHAHVCHVYEVGEAAPHKPGAESTEREELRPFIAMEFVDGESLAARIAHGPLKLEEAVRLAGEIAAALGAAHDAGIVHRDVKSGNVMLTAKGEAKVLDFGLAQTNASTKLTRQGSTVGTVSYMSPEQARGEEVDRRTDLWSLGVVLYEMLAGRLPFKADYEQAVLYAILNEDPEPLTAVRTGVGMELEAIVEKLLRKEPVQRYQTGGDVVADLVHAAAMRRKSGEHQTRQTISVAVQATAPKKRMSLGVPQVAFLIAVTAVLSTISVWILITRGPEAAVGPIRQIPIYIEGVRDLRSPAFNRDQTVLCFDGRERDRIRAVYCHDLTTRKTQWIADQVSVWARPSFGPDGQLAYSTEQGIFLRRLDQDVSVLVSDTLFFPFWIDQVTVGASTSANDQIVAVNVSDRSVTPLVRRNDLADSSRALFSAGMHPSLPILMYWLEAGEEGTLYARNMETGKDSKLADHAMNARFVGENYVTYQSGNNGIVVGSEFDSHALRLSGLPEPMVDEINFNKHGLAPGDLLVVSTPSGKATVRRWSAAGVALGSIQIPVRPSPVPRFSPDGSRLLFAYRKNLSDPDDELIVVDLTTGLTQTVDDSQGSSIDAEWTVTGDEVVYERVTRSGASAMFRASARGVGSPQFIAAGRFPRLANSGRLLAYVRAVDSKTNSFVVRDLASGHERQIAPAPGDVRVSGFSPDDRYLMVRVGSERYVYSLADLSRTRIPYETWSWGPDGRSIYGQSGGDLVRALYSTESGFKIGKSELQFSVGECPLGERSCGVYVGEDRILTIGYAGGEEDRDYSVIIWHQGFVKAKNRPH